MDPTTGNLIVATTAAFDASEAGEGGEAARFQFHAVNPETAVATALGSLDRGVDESSDAYYAGYHRVVSGDGKSLYRVGMKAVSKGSGPGYGTTSTDGIKSVWQAQDAAEGHGYYFTAHRYSNSTTSGDEIISLAPRESQFSPGFDAVVWSPEGKAPPRVVASFGNAHPPRVNGVHLGYVAATVRGNSFAALVVDYSALDPKLGDRWAIAVADVAQGGAKVLPLVPRDIATTWAAAGLGW